LDSDEWGFLWASLISLPCSPARWFTFAQFVSICMVSNPEITRWTNTLSFNNK
jgi:hypothetical protein